MGRLQQVLRANADQQLLHAAGVGDFVHVDRGPVEQQRLLRAEIELIETATITSNWVTSSQEVFFPQ